MAISTVRTVISDQLIIRACNTPGGSGGVWKWNVKVQVASLRALKIAAPVGNPLNHALDFGYVPGCYRDGFKAKRGGNGHKTFSVLYNDCPHARFVELGRSASNKVQWLTVPEAPFRLIEAHHTSAIRGKHIMFPTVNQVAKRMGMKSAVGSIISRPLR